MVYLMYFVSFLVFIIAVFGIKNVFENVKNFGFLAFKKILRFGFKLTEFMCNAFIARHTLVILGQTSFNIGNAALFFALSGVLVGMLGYPTESLTEFTIFGTIMTVTGYIASNCKKIQ